MGTIAKKLIFQLADKYPEVFEKIPDEELFTYIDLIHERYEEDKWSYARQIRKCLDDIELTTHQDCDVLTLQKEVRGILNRVKGD